jgi:hypothetical protein
MFNKKTKNLKSLMIMTGQKKFVFEKIWVDKTLYNTEVGTEFICASKTNL